MQNYLRLLKIFYRNTLITELEYRSNFWSNIGLSIFWLISALLGARVFFFHTDQIAGWSYNELLIVMGLFFAMNGYRQIILQPNLSRLSEYIRLGTLDYILTKPINSQFLVSLRNIGIYNCSDPLLGLGLVVFALWQMKYVPNVSQILLSALLLLAAMVILYSLNLIMQTMNFWLINLDQIDMLAWSFLEAGRFPVTFYNGWLRVILTVVVPVAFLTTFPAQALLGRLDWWVLVSAICLAVLSFAGATVFWIYALRFYSSASS